MYDEVGKIATYKYRKAKQQSVSLSYKKDEYDIILSYVQDKGIPLATFIKIAVKEKMERDN